MAEASSPYLPETAPHVVDELIEDRARKLRTTAAWPLVKAVGYPLLGYRPAVRMADAIAPLSGDETLDWVSHYLGLRTLASGLEHIPESGPCVIVANHPGGIADGIALWDALRPRRPDMLFMANRDALKVCAGLEDRIIPVEWRDHERSRAGSREVLRRTIEAFRDGRCLVIFPSGRMSEWSWKRWALKEKPWAPTAASLARKFNIPIIPLAVRQRMPLLYYGLAQINEELKDMTIFAGFIGKKRSQYRLDFLEPVDANALDGDDAAATETLRALCEEAAWGKRAR